MEDNNTKTKELDLLDAINKLFKMLWHALQSIINFSIKILSYLLLFAFKKWIPLLIVFLIGIGYGALRFSGKERLVRSDMVIRNNEMPNDELITILNELALYAEQDNKTALARSLNTDTIVADKIKFLGAYWFIDEDADGVADYVDYKNSFNYQKDTLALRIKHILDIRVKVDDPKVLPVIEDGIVYYLQNNSILKNLNDSRILALETMVDKTENELEELDRLQNYEYFEKQQNSDIDLGNIGKLRLQGEEKDTRLLHNDVLSLQQKKLDYQKQLNVYKDIVSVMSGFAISVKPERSLSSTMTMNGLKFLLVAYIILFLLGHRKFIMKYLEEKSKF